MSSSSISIERRKDPTWKYTILKDPKNTNVHVCPYCQKETRGGISRQKEHLIGTKRPRKNVTLCKKVPDDVKHDIEKYEKQQEERRKQQLMESIIPNNEEDDMFEVDCEEDLEEVGRSHGKGKAPVNKGTSISSRGSNISISSEQCKRKKGPMDAFVTPDPELEVAKDDRRRKLRQKSVLESVDKEMVARVHQDIARFWYQAGIPFNVARLKSFRVMLKSVGQFGPHLPPPSYHQLRVPLLEKELEHTSNLLEEQKAIWMIKGCSFMTDGWTDRTSRTLINFLVNSPRGTVFLKSIDASAEIKTGEKMFEIIEKELLDLDKEVGIENVIQVITDNAANLKYAGEKLQEKFKLYWTPCAAHCINLMLKDLAKIPQVKRALSRAMQVTGFIYSHTKVINIMKTFTNKKDIVRPAKTRFATSYITLQSIHKAKNNLRSMFADDVWKKSSFAREEKGKVVEKIIFMTSFWNDVFYALKLTTPLVRVLKLVDNEKKPAMGYIYEAMDRAKEAIIASFGGEANVDKYKKAFEYIDKRWEVQMHRPLHAAGYYLNPAFFYYNPNIQSDEEVQKGLYDVITRLVEPMLHDAILNELSTYRNAGGLFGHKLAKDSRKTKSPADWWDSFGASTPNLQKLAVRILSLTCSSSGCERNWSAFEQIHTKKRNKLDHQRLNDLAYIKYNQKMMESYETEDVTNPINLFDIGESNEWYLGEFGEGEDNADNELVSDDADITWGDVATATGVEEPLRNVRSVTVRGGSSLVYSSRRGGTSTQASGSRARRLISEPEEEEEEFNSEEGDSEEEDEEDANLDLEDEDGDDGCDASDDA